MAHGSTRSSTLEESKSLGSSVDGIGETLRAGEFVWALTRTGRTASDWPAGAAWQARAAVNTPGLARHIAMPGPKAPPAAPRARGPPVATHTAHSCSSIAWLIPSASKRDCAGKGCVSSAGSARGGLPDARAVLPA